MGCDCVTDPDEIEALREAMDDQNNPSYTTAEALAYLRSGHGDYELGSKD
jgi:hypothetical protein